MDFKTNPITNENQSYIEFNSDAGILTVNVSRKEARLTIPDIGMGEATFQMGIGHIYSNMSYINNSYVGQNWKLNIEQYVIPYQTSYNLEEYKVGNYIYIDGSGYLHRFERFNTNKYIDKSGTGLIMSITETGYQIESLDSNYYIFDQSGRLTSHKSDNIEKKIIYENGQSVKYYDTRLNDRYLKLEYNENLLKRIALISKGKELEEVRYSYIGNYLNGIFHFKNKTLAGINLYKYDNLGNLIFATGTNDGIALKISYEDGIKVSKGISKITSDKILELINLGMSSVGEEFTLDKSFVIEKEDIKTGKYKNDKEKGMYLTLDGEYYLEDEYLVEETLSETEIDKGIESLIFTELGHKVIEDIEIGDKVWAYNEETGEQELKEVVTLFRNKADTTYTAYINIEKNGSIETEKITSTDEHPYYILNDTLCIDKKNNGYWVAAQDLVEGMKVLLYNCFIGIVGKVEKEIHETPVDTFNFEVADSHTYYVGANSILVHNMCTIDDLSDASFAQTNYREEFSKEGIEIYSKMARRKINTIDELAGAITDGTIKSSKINLDYIVRDGNKLILNTRSSQALIRAGVSRSLWVGINRTGNALFEEMLTGQLTRNRLTSAGCMFPISSKIY